MMNTRKEVMYMKKYLGYLVIIVLGVVAIVSLINRSESLNNNVVKNSSNAIELFS